MNVNAVERIVTGLTEPRQQLDESRKIFSNKDLRRLIVPLFFEQLLAVLVGEMCIRDRRIYCRGRRRICRRNRHIGQR